MIKNKKDLIWIITFTVTLIFAFIYISPIFSFIVYIFKLISPFLIGLIIAFVLNVLMNAVENKWCKNLFKDLSNKTKRVLSLTLSLTIIFGMIAFIGLLIIPQLGNTIEIFSDNLPVYETNINNFLNKFGVSMGEGSVVNTVFDSIGTYINANQDNVLNITLGVASNVVSAIVTFTIALVFAIYVLGQKEKLSDQLKKLLKAYVPDKFINKSNNIIELANKTFSNFVTGQCLEALIIGVLCFIGMIILRIPYATTISVLVGFTALIPVFGAFIGTFIGAFLILMISPIKAIIFIIFIVILQQFEGNLIYPKVIGKSVNLPAIWVLVAVTIGASMNGVVGMLLSVPVCSILYSVLVNNVNNRIKEKEKGKK